MTKKKTLSNEIEGAEYGVDSRYIQKRTRKEDGQELLAARLERMKDVSADQIIRAKLLQLKLRMEAYIQAPTDEKEHCFTDFLATYIDTLYPKRSNFASDIDVTPVRLSQVLNNHREPQDEFMRRLMIHSEKIFEDVCSFQKRTWYEVYYREKISEIMLSQEVWGPKAEKHVKYSQRKKK